MKKNDMATATIDIEDLVLDYLDLKKRVKEAESDLKLMKIDIDEFANANIEGFGKDGVLELSTGVLKISKNPPKAIWVDTEAPLSLEDKKQLALALPENFRSVQIDLKKVALLRTSDKILDKTLKAKCVDIIQESRFDVKEL